MKLLHGDCGEVLGDISMIDSVITDPPYGIKFMGKRWDYNVPSVKTWRAVLDAMKPGAHLLAFGGARTYHRMAVNVEDAGFEIRDQIFWVYASGFPKSLNISKALDKAAGVDRKVVGEAKSWNRPDSEAGDLIRMNISPGTYNITAPATDAAKEWNGWGTALKPAHEPIILARKPLDGTAAANVLKHGCGGLNIDASRVLCELDGRWPANLIHDGSDEVLAGFPISGTGSSSRFFYCAKVSRSERGDANNHPTVKPIALMEYLIKLVTPPRGTVLDPFMGSGSTGVAATRLGFDFIGIELDKGYFEIAHHRIQCQGEGILPGMKG